MDRECPHQPPVIDQNENDTLIRFIVHMHSKFGRGSKSGRSPCSMRSCGECNKWLARENRELARFHDPNDYANFKKAKTAHLKAEK